MKRVLIVEDEADNRTAIRVLLKKSGYASTEAVDGAEGLAKAERTHPDVILLDIRMPGLDGYEVCRRLKENPATAVLPVIFLTAVQDDTPNRLAYDAGGVACITKPFRTEALVAVIANAERRAKPEREDGGLDTDLPRSLAPTSAGQRPCSATGSAT